MNNRQSTIRNRQSLRLHIERLVLDGLPIQRSQGAVFQSALESELARLLTERGVPPALSQGGALARIDGGAFHLAPESKAQTTATQVAQAVYGGLSQ